LPQSGVTAVEQHAGHHPGQLVEAAEVADDPRQGGADDALVERGEQHAGHQAADDHQDLAMGKLRRLVVRRFV